MHEVETRLARRPLGRTGLEVSPLALAAMSVRAAGPKGLRLRAEDVEHAFYEHGVNTFLVVRQMGQLTEGLRRLIRAGHRDELVLVSMASLPFGWSVRRAWEKNARALGADSIDVFLLGWVQGRWHVGGKTWPEMLRLREEGKVRAVGFSCHKRKLIAELARTLDLDVLMVRYNAAHRGAEREVFDTLGPGRPGIIAYTATRWGLLLQPLPGAGFAQGLSAAECYRFALGHPAVDTVLCAARTREELCMDVAGVLKGAIEPARLEEVRRFGDAVHASTKRGLRWMFQEQGVRS
jgi:aryl-alcohol dehydrogenase-like predicted oxidoreductase